ncbi:MAG: hypothetical protein Q4G30_05450 [Actinomycetaceae bacterium]|nr:hypothetical protein [Actinomycetaceae bacterium]
MPNKAIGTIASVIGVVLVVASVFHLVAETAHLGFGGLSFPRADAWAGFANSTAALMALRIEQVASLLVIWVVLGAMTTLLTDKQLPALGNDPSKEPPPSYRIFTSSVLLLFSLLVMVIGGAWTTISSWDVPMAVIEVPLSLAALPIPVFGIWWAWIAITQLRSLLLAHKEGKNA